MYTVTCEDCGGSSVVNITDTVSGKIVEWLKIEKVISARQRLDLNMGWQCMCGNNSLMTKQEIESIANHAQPEPQEIEDIKKNLVYEPKTGFLVEAINVV